MIPTDGRCNHQAARRRIGLACRRASSGRGHTTGRARSTGRKTSQRSGARPYTSKFTAWAKSSRPIGTLLRDPPCTPTFLWININQLRSQGLTPSKRLTPTLETAPPHFGATNFQFPLQGVLQCPVWGHWRDWWPRLRQSFFSSDAVPVASPDQTPRRFPKRRLRLTSDLLVGGLQQRHG